MKAETMRRPLLPACTSALRMKRRIQGASVLWDTELSRHLPRFGLRLARMLSEYLDR